MRELKSLLAELVAKLGHRYEGSYLEAATRAPGAAERLAGRTKNVNKAVAGPTNPLSSETR